MPRSSAITCPGASKSSVQMVELSAFILAILPLSLATPAEKYPTGFVWRDHPLKVKAGVISLDEKLAPPPSKVDWRGTRVAPVRDQGKCGSCWAFSAAGAIEGGLAGATGAAPITLSVEQILLCCVGSMTKGCFGCGGGEPYQAYEYVMNSTHGLDADSDYPYDEPSPFAPHTCKAAEKPAKAKVTGWAYAVAISWAHTTPASLNTYTLNGTEHPASTVCMQVPRALPEDGQHADPDKEMALAAVVAQYAPREMRPTQTLFHSPIQQSFELQPNSPRRYGPVSVAVDASTLLTRYHRGVYKGPCSSGVKDLTHAMLVVGYDLDEKYWIVKNSMGERWGEDGYARMVMGKNICGITDEATLVNVTVA